MELMSELRVIGQRVDPEPPLDHFLCCPSVADTARRIYRGWMTVVLKLDRWGDGQSRCEAVKQWGSKEVSAGRLRAVPWSHLHPFVTIPNSRDTAMMENKGNV